MAFDFHTQLKIGKKGEKFIADYSPTEFSWVLEEKAYDLKPLVEVSSCGLVFPELKTDTSSKAKELFDRGKDPNFFIERISNDVDNLDGGPWQARQKGFPIYMYLYWYKKYLHLFNTQKLIERMDEIIAKKDRKLYPVFQRGGRFRTLGYITKSQEIQDLAIYVDLNKPGQKLFPLFEKLLNG